MSDKQNPKPDDDNSAREPSDDSEDKGGEAPRSYYYDDATGYEIYKEEDETDEVVNEKDG